MSTHKHIDIIYTVILALIIVPIYLILKDGIQLANNTSYIFTSEDLDITWMKTSPNITEIILSESSISVNGSGALVQGNKVYVVTSGKYRVTGNISDGSIVVDAQRADKIWIGLNNTSINSINTAPIRVEQANHVYITTYENTENNLSTDMEYNASGVDGVIYSKDDITLNGTGTLNIKTEHCHGIVCNDDMAITSGRINIEAGEDGVHANDSFSFCNAELNVTAIDDGITASNIKQTGQVYIESGNINILKSYEGIEGNNVAIAGGDIDIIAKDDGINAGGNSNPIIRIQGGNIRIYCPEGWASDGLDSNGSIYIEDGNILISLFNVQGNCPIDYGDENGGECIISGGQVVACGGSISGYAFQSKSDYIIYAQDSIGSRALENIVKIDIPVTLREKTGTVLISEIIPYNFNVILMYTPYIKAKETYTLNIEGQETEITMGINSNSNISNLTTQPQNNMQVDNTLVQNPEQLALLQLQLSLLVVSTIILAVGILIAVKTKHFA